MLALDTLGIFQATCDTSTLLANGVSLVKDNSSKLAHITEVENIVILGMGGSGIVGDLVAAVLDELPIKVVKSYETPAFVNEKTLVLAVSFSGNTQETLKAVKGALASSASVVAITTGGKLAERVDTVFQVSTTAPMPRAGLAEMGGAALQILAELGIYKNATKDIGQAEAHIANRVEELQSPARQLAHDIGRTIPLILGASGVGALAAKRWKNQINENAKSAAFFSEVPEAFHNEIAGWGQNGDVTRQVFSLIQLRSNFEDPILEKAFSVSLEMQREVMANSFEIRAQGESKLAQLLDLILLGDFMSLYMADLVGVDPGPIPAIDDFKHQLSGS